MKRLTLVSMFAATLAAQRPETRQPDPEIELAAPIAAETQERDLAKAERMYREAIDGGKLSAEGRMVATMRLARMLRTLGREKEGDALMEKLMRETPVASLDDVTATPQDAEREAALRKQAEALVADIEARRGVPDVDSPRAVAILRWVPHDAAQQLLWIGQPAVPVVVARLEAMTKADGFHPDAVSGLAGFLWRVGGPQAKQFFTESVKHADPAWRALHVRTAFQASPEMLATAALFLRDPDEHVFQTLLASPPQPSGAIDTDDLRFRLPQTDIVDAALTVDGDARKAWVLRWATNDVLLEPAPRDRLVAFVGSDAVRSSAIGVAAQDFLLSQNAQQSIAGLELLLRALPRLVAAGREPSPRTPLRPYPGTDPQVLRREIARSNSFTRDEASRLLPVLDQAVQETPLAGENVQMWFAALCSDVAAPLDDVIVPYVLKWIPRGFLDGDGRLPSTNLLKGRVTAANYRDIAAALERLPSKQVVVNLGCHLRESPIDPPADLSPMLRDVARKIRPVAGPAQAFEQLLFSNLVARTGDPGAAEWLLEGNAAADLIELGRRSKDERVRAAMRTMYERLGSGRKRDPEKQPQLLLLALIAMHDASSLALVSSAIASENERCFHPYGTGDKLPLLTPLQYLVYQDANPPHGFTEDDAIGVLQKIAVRGIPDDWEPKSWSTDAIPDRVLGELARLTAFARTSAPYGADWIWTIQERLKARAERNEPLGPLADWHQQMLATPAAHVVLYYLDEATAVRLRPQIERLVGSEDGTIAFSAINNLARYFDVKTIEWAKRLVANPDKSVREKGLEIAAELRGDDGEAIALQMTQDPTELRGDAAAVLGEMVSVKAVPRLVELLRDPESYVREKAAEALTRIRFYHEQQAHWDRVLKGLDASPASAAEKLLLQAKPGAAKTQRLLALESLGTLGVPEALPFLIDWTTDPDAQIAAAAKAAITAIHLNPRR